MDGNVCARYDAILSDFVKTDLDGDNKVFCIYIGTIILFIIVVLCI